MPKKDGNPSRKPYKKPQHKYDRRSMQRGTNREGSGGGTRATVIIAFALFSAPAAGMVGVGAFIAHGYGWF